MAELQCLSSKQQILLNSNHVSDEQKRENGGELTGAGCEKSSELNEVRNQVFSSPSVAAETSRYWFSAKTICLVFKGDVLSPLSAPNNLMSESNQFTLFN